MGQWSPKPHWGEKNKTFFKCFTEERESNRFGMTCW